MILLCNNVVQQFMGYHAKYLLVTDSPWNIATYTALQNYMPIAPLFCFERLKQHFSALCDTGSCQQFGPRSGGYPISW